MDVLLLLHLFFCAESVPPLLCLAVISSLLAFTRGETLFTDLSNGQASQSWQQDIRCGMIVNAIVLDFFYSCSRIWEKDMFEETLGF